MSKKSTKEASLEPRGILIAIGGKEDKGEEVDEDKQENGNFIQMAILERFCQELEGEDPLIVIIPTASTVPDETAQDYITVFGKLGYSNIKVADIRSREDAFNPEYLDIIKNAAGLMFTGGDQLRLTCNTGWYGIAADYKTAFYYRTNCNCRHQCRGSSHV